MAHLAGSNYDVTVSRHDIIPLERFARQWLFTMPRLIAVVAVLVVGTTFASVFHEARAAHVPTGVPGRRPLQEDTPSRAAGPCVCIFDFDHTLRIQNATGWDTGSPDSTGIVRKCREFGYGVALASANCDSEKMKLILPNHIDDDIFTPEWFESPAFQHCDHYKTNELTKILDFFETSAACAMFFDDLAFNVEVYGSEVGVNWRLVNPEYGVTWDDFWGLMPKLEERCECVGI